MAQYYILNTNTGELHSQWEDQALAEETCNSLNDSQPYDSTDAYACFSEAGYKAYVEGLPGFYVPVYSVYGVGKHSDAYPPMEKMVMAEKPNEARKQFEAKYPEYKAVSAYQVM